MFVRWDRAVLSLGLTIPHYWPLNLLCTLPSPLWILRYFSLPGRKKNTLGLVCGLALLFLILWGRFLIDMCWSILSHVFEGDLLPISGVISLCRSLLFPVKSSCLGLLRLSAPSPAQKKSSGLHIGCISLISMWPGKPIGAGNGNSCWVHHVCFLCLK